MHNNMHKLIVYIVLVLLVIANIDAKKQRKQPKNQVTEETNVIQVSTSNSNEAKTSIDQCEKTRCGAGKECIIDSESGQAKCQCISVCSDNTDVRRRVCSNQNTTWQSDCHMFRHRCLCLEGLSTDCTEEHKHMHIDYYGECQLLPECRKEVLEDFPRRMREWLDHIISKKLHVNKDNSDHLTRKWIDAIIWKFCDLDKQPHDRHVSRHELFPLRAPLLSMESCISEFLNNCDANDDHKITLIEWGQCLGATDAEMEDKCTQFKASQE